MKSILIILAILCTGCATASNHSTEFDWREGEIRGSVGLVPYTFEGDEITFDLFSHNTQEWSGQHKLHIEDDEIEYKLKYVF